MTLPRHAPVGNAVGASLPRIETRDKITGRADYTDDLTRPGMLHGALLGSPYAHARILSYDVSQALALPGVKAVITSADLPDIRFGLLVSDQPALARGKVRYVGEPVAAVAAVDRGTARRALQLVQIEYEELPAVLDPQAATASDAPILHEGFESYRMQFANPGGRNVTSTATLAQGDIEAGFAQAEVIVEGEYETPAQQHMYLEPCAAVAEFDGTGKVTVWASVQSVFRSQALLAEALALPMSKVRVIAPMIGGGFGGKGEQTVEIIAAALARASGRPVKIALSRDEDMIMMRSRHKCRIRMRTGARKDGTIVAREGEILLDGGAYAEESPLVMAFAVLMMNGPYRIAHAKYAGRVAYTNRLRAGAFRGFGNPQAHFASECQIDELAEKLGMDPIELRLKNAISEGDRWIGGHRVDSCSLRECLEKVRDASDWTRRRKQMPSAGGKRRGIGISAVTHVCGLLGAAAMVRLNEDGTVSLNTGAVDIGQGSDTVLAQICAGVLGVPVESVSSGIPDTEYSPYNLATGASRVTYIVGHAVAQAAERVREQIFVHAGEMLECAPDDLELRPGGRVGIKGVPQKEMPFVAVSGRALYAKGGAIMGTHSWKFDGDMFDPKRAAFSGFNLEDVGIHCFGAQCVEVEVDEETGKVEVLGVWSAHDVGRALNPGAVNGQVHGGVVQGLGYALVEELVWDEGRLANPSMMDYKIPGSLDVPYEIHPIILENPEPTGPFGARGVGEMSLIGVAPAVANAIANAVDVRIRNIPATAEKVLRGLIARGTR